MTISRGHRPLHEAKTDGIAIQQWSVATPTDDAIRLNIWDFGGQEIMHATHQFFLIQRSFYLLTLDARQGKQESRVEYWLKLIQITEISSSPLGRGIESYPL